MQAHRHTNQLISETSPYLLQHAHNPVNWMPWGEAALNKAKDENKLLLISIGYAACHWCHVMEHESFENEEVAEVMNRHFVCIKVDREERPDVDQLYMTAVQLMTQRGGWPLNAVALPDGSPIWGGTYFTKDTWISSLKQIAAYHKLYPAKTTEYAEKLAEGIKQSSLIPVSGNTVPITTDAIGEAVKSWQEYFDLREGGNIGAPKFMLPVNLNFLLHWSHVQNDAISEQFIRTTLEKMAQGGIYDQVGGGFARYSTDAYWKVPHFEKMLYDNGQLLSLYARAYRKFGDESWKQLYFETVEWIKQEMLSPESGFYSSLDADSEGVEGKYYVWDEAELRGLIGVDFELFSDYFNLNKNGYWEDGNYILLRKQSNRAFAGSKSLDQESLSQKVTHWKKVLLKERNKRIAPGLDDKILTSWNAMVIRGLTEGYKAFGADEFLEMAKENLHFILAKLQPEPGLLLHSFKNDLAKIDGFLEDYAFVIQAQIDLFEVTGDAELLIQANRFCETCFDHFYDSNLTAFYFSKNRVGKQLSRSLEVQDNVIPSSNSVMAHNLFRLGKLLDKPKYLDTAAGMLKTVSETILHYPSAHANWLDLAIQLSLPHFEVVIAGDQSLALTKQFHRHFLPNALVCPGNDEQLPLLKNRLVADKSKIYVCVDQHCKMPVESVEDAIRLID